MAKNNLERTGFICFTHPNPRPSLREAKAETHEGQELGDRNKSRDQRNAVYSLLIRFVVTYLSPRTICLGVALPISIINQGNAPTDLPKGQSDGGLI